MRPVERGPAPCEFKAYQEAAPYLKERLGRYCSYCERAIPTQLAVEHVSPKSIDPAKALDWNNFLLACANCNSTKAATSVNELDVLRPDQHDTFGALRYAESGSVKPSAAHDAKAAGLIRLVGLDRTPATATNADHRFDDRLEAWGKAVIAKDLISKSGVERPLAIEIVKGHGHWSIWMTVFADDAAMQASLIAAFPSTAGRRLATISV
jgi:uncharacterized protein (TIGR02646 family)